jgi:hypothetical protein
VEFHDGESEKERKDRKDGRIEGKTKRRVQQRINRANERGGGK